MFSMAREMKIKIILGESQEKVRHGVPCLNLHKKCKLNKMTVR